MNPTPTLQTVTVHDYQSGSMCGIAQIDMSLYRLWASGPSETVEASRVLTPEQCEALNVQPEQTIFVVE